MIAYPHTCATAVTDGASCSVVWGVVSAAICFICTIPRTLNGISYMSVVSFISILGECPWALITLYSDTLPSCYSYNNDCCRDRGPHRQGYRHIKPDMHTRLSCSHRYCKLLAQIFLGWSEHCLLYTDLCICRACGFLHIHRWNEETRGLPKDTIHSSNMRYHAIPYCRYRRLFLRWGYRYITRPGKHWSHCTESCIRYCTAYHHRCGCCEWSRMRQTSIRENVRSFVPWVI